MPLCDAIEIAHSACIVGQALFKPALLIEKIV